MDPRLAATLRQQVCSESSMLRVVKNADHGFPDLIVRRLHINLF
jgi:hypothetical protein